MFGHEVVRDVSRQIPVFLLWYLVVALVIRRTGILLTLSISQLVRERYSWREGKFIAGCGFLLFGMGCFLCTSVDDYVEWRLFGNDYYDPSLLARIPSIILWAVGGIVFGWVMWKNVWVKFRGTAG